MAFEALFHLEKMGLFFLVESLDLTQREHPSLGRRELVLTFKQPKGRHILRLTPYRYHEELERYTQLEFDEGDLLIDLRTPNLAFIKRKPS